MAVAISSSMVRRIWWSDCVDAGGVEIGADLAEHVLVAGLLEIGRDDRLGVGVGAVAGLAELLRRPQAEQLVAARRRP